MTAANARTSAAADDSRVSSVHGRHQEQPVTTSTPDDGRLWAVTVTIPAHLDEGDRDDLFDLVADTAHRWEPDDRDGWDIDVSAGLDTPCPYVVTGDEGTSHCTLAESATG